MRLEKRLLPSCTREIASVSVGSWFLPVQRLLPPRCPFVLQLVRISSLLPIVVPIPCDRCGGEGRVKSSPIRGVGIQESKSRRNQCM